MSAAGRWAIIVAAAIMAGVVLTPLFEWLLYKILADMLWDGWVLTGREAEVKAVIFASFVTRCVLLVLATGLGAAVGVFIAQATKEEK